jgi:two-component sensor histidine kinase
MRGGGTVAASIGRIDVRGVETLDRASGIAAARIRLTGRQVMTRSSGQSIPSERLLGDPAARHTPHASTCHSDVLHPLRDPVCPDSWGGRPVLWPLWANEAIHRGYVMVRLNATLMDRSRPSRDTPLGRQVDARIAASLAAVFRSMVIVCDEDLLPCSRVLRDAARDLVELFGPAAGRVTIGTRIERVSLPAYQRRALVLAASELVSNALLHAFCGRSGGHIQVELEAFEPSRARLVVTDDGCGMPRVMPRNRLQVGRDLASLLEAEISYRVAAGGGTAAQIEFPFGGGTGASKAKGVAP